MLERWATPSQWGPNVWPAGWYLSIEGTDRVLAHGSEDAGGDGRRPPFPRNTVDPTGHRSGKGCATVHQHYYEHR